MRAYLFDVPFLSDLEVSSDVTSALFEDADDSTTLAGISRPRSPPSRLVDHDLS